MFVWIKGRPFLLVMDLTASIRTQNKTHFFLYYCTAFKEVSNLTYLPACLVLIITLQVTNPKPIRHLLSSLCSGPYLALGVLSPHLDSYENPSYLQAHFCHIPHNLIFLFIFIIIPLLLQLSFTYSFLITVSTPWDRHTTPNATHSLVLFWVCNIQYKTFHTLRYQMDAKLRTSKLLPPSFLLFYSYFSICTSRTYSFLFLYQISSSPILFLRSIKICGREQKNWILT